MLHVQHLDWQKLQVRLQRLQHALLHLPLLLRLLVPIWLRVLLLVVLVLHVLHRRTLCFW
jgi:hypothetical protein